MKQYNIKDFLYMSWLRPENVIWDAIASDLIFQELKNAKNILEVGIGNGYFTFMTLGGKFKKEYDWYYNVNTEDFWNDKDIYDYVNIDNIKEYIIEIPKIRLKYAIDHKLNLLDQARQLEFVDELILQDANDIIRINDISTIYSNMLYWLRDPISQIKNYDMILNESGKLVLVFPNSNFYRYCQSYGRKNKLQVLLNRGRADSIMWSIDIEDFEKIIREQTTFHITKFQKFLAGITLRIWDIGLRPISAHLIDMVNNLDKKTRMKIKDEWCETMLKFLEELLVIELENGKKEGGFNFVVLEK